MQRAERLDKRREVRYEKGRCREMRGWIREMKRATRRSDAERREVG